MRRRTIRPWPCSCTRPNRTVRWSALTNGRGAGPCSGCRGRGRGRARRARSRRGRRRSRRRGAAAAASPSGRGRRARTARRSRSGGRGRSGRRPDRPTAGTTRVSGTSIITPPRGAQGRREVTRGCARAGVNRKGGTVRRRERSDGRGRRAGPGGRLGGGGAPSRRAHRRRHLDRLRHPGLPRAERRLDEEPGGREDVDHRRTTWATPRCGGGRGSTGCSRRPGRPEPNAGHRAVVELERQGRLHTLITQNVDGLHQGRGSTPAQVVEVHGTMREDRAGSAATAGRWRRRSTGCGPARTTRRASSAAGSSSRRRSRSARRSSPR